MPATTTTTPTSESFQRETPVSAVVGHPSVGGGMGTKGGESVVVSPPEDPDPKEPPYMPTLQPPALCPPRAPKRFPVDHPASILGQRIRVLRKSQGVTQRFLAESLGLHPSTVSAWETCRMQTDLETIGRICAVLPTSPEVLTSGIDISVFAAYPGDRNGHPEAPNPRQDGNSIFCERMRARRALLHLNTRRLSHAAGITPSQVQHIQNGTCSPSLRTACRLAAALGTTISYLVGETDNPKRTRRVPSEH